MQIALPEKGSVRKARVLAFLSIVRESYERDAVDGLLDLLWDSEEFSLALLKLAGFLQVREAQAWAGRFAGVILYASAEGFIPKDDRIRAARVAIARLPVHHFAATEESAALYRMLARDLGLMR